MSPGCSSTSHWPPGTWVSGDGAKGEKAHGSRGWSTTPLQPQLGQISHTRFLTYGTSRRGGSSRRESGVRQRGHPGGGCEESSGWSCRSSSGVNEPVESVAMMVDFARGGRDGGALRDASGLQSFRRMPLTAREVPACGPPVLDATPGHTPTAAPPWTCCPTAPSAPDEGSSEGNRTEGS